MECKIEGIDAGDRQIAEIQVARQLIDPTSAIGEAMRELCIG
jgi:hypothetical protein